MIPRERGSVTHNPRDVQCKLTWLLELGEESHDAEARCDVCRPCDTPEREQAAALVRELGS